MFNIIQAEEHLGRWPHPAGLSAWDLAKGLNETEQKDGKEGLYDPVWPALRQAYAKYYAIYEPKAIRVLLYRQYHFSVEYGVYPYRWIYWREPDRPDGLDRTDPDPKSFLKWYPSRFNEQDYELYSDGVHSLSPEGQKRATKNRKHIVDRLKAQFQARKQGKAGEFKLPDWDYLKACPDTERVPF